MLDRLFKLRLSHMSEALEKQFLNPNSALEDFTTRITEIINYEWDQRQTTKFNKLLKKATLKYPRKCWSWKNIHCKRIVHIRAASAANR